MTAKKSVRVIDDIMELMEIVNLTAIRPFALVAQVTGPAADPPTEPEITLEYAELLTEVEFHTRFKLEVKESDATYVADIASIYEMSEPVKLDHAVAIDFAERVGFMATFPFLREAITTSAARMGRAIPLIGLMRPGDFKIEVESEHAHDEKNPHS